ncbi:MAG: D-aminoacyl-tRNA deacylase [Oligoflexus sp.]|jgi:D-tyrosyl-tRNA(Tyr) deacylase
MRAVIQRVSWAQVTVDSTVIGRIEKGLLVLLGVAQGDDHSTAQALVEKLIHLRIFANEEGRFDRSVQDVGGSILVVSQFTLLGDCRKGRRPNFTEAAAPAEASALYTYVIELLQKTGIPTATGQFQAHMEVASANDGPVTIILDLPANSREGT